MTWCILDLETQNIPYLGHVSSPRNPENYIVAAGWSIDHNPVESLYFESKKEALASNWLEGALANQKYLVCHNAGFELHWLYHCYPDTLLDFFKRGGQVWCTQLAEFMLSHHQDMYPKLIDCSEKYGGDQKIDAVSILWKQGVLTADIDKALLMEYLAGERTESEDGTIEGMDGDVANTRRVCFAQHKLLVEQGMYKAFQVRCMSLLFNAMSTYHGLYVDMDVARTNQAEQEKQIEDIKADVLSNMPELPDDFEFSFTSGNHKSALLYGGTVKYRAQVPYDPPKFEKVDAYEYVERSGITKYISEASLLMAYNSGSYSTIEDWEKYNFATVTRYKSGKNKGLPKPFKIDSDVPLTKWGDKEFKFDGLINLYDLPQTVQEKFLGDRAEYKGANELSCGTPVYSTAGEVLELLVAYTEAATPLLKLASLIKDTTSFYLSTSETGKVKGMLQYVGSDGILNHSLNNCATVTGRLSGSRPNLQQLPRDGTSKVKEMFVSRFGKEGRMVEVDYSALEVVALATISGDKNLMRMLIEGIDMHCYRLAAKLKEDYESVKLKCKDHKHPEHKLYSQMRTDIKPRAFSHQYGASASGIAYSTGCTVEDAEEFKRIEFELFPESNAYPAQVIRPMVELTGQKAKPQREQFDDGSYGIYRRGYFQAKSGNCYSFRQVKQWSKEARKHVLDYKDTHIANYVIQGEASFIVQAACGRIISWILKEDDLRGKALPVNTVHDCIMFDCVDEVTAIEVGTKVKELMESTPEWLSKVIPDLLDWNYNITPFPAELELGYSMMEKATID